MNNDVKGVSGMQNMTAIQALQNAAGNELNTLFLSQMLTMHEAKLAELQTALPRITDPILKSAVIKALLKIRRHSDMLARMNKGTNINGQ